MHIVDSLGLNIIAASSNLDDCLPSCRHEAESQRINQEEVIIFYLEFTGSALPQTLQTVCYLFYPLPIHLPRTVLIQLEGEQES